MTKTLKNDINEARNAINSAQSFLLTCHVHPDGDALGSTLAMAHSLISAGKKVTATFPDPFIIPYSLRETLPGIEILQDSSVVVSANETYDIAMTFDCGSKSRLVGLEKLLDSATTFINVDHHLSNERFGDINVIDYDAASSGTVVLSIIDACGIDLNAKSAQCMYVALLTDTGRFQFSSTTSKVFDQASRLAEFDLPIAKMSRVLTEEDPYSFLKLVGQAIGSMDLDEKSGVVSAVATIEMQKKYNVKYDEIEGLIEFIRRTRESDVACAVKEFAQDDYRVSLRSLGQIDVCEIASKFGGGGHRYAAGFSSTKSPRQIIEMVRQEVLSQRNLNS